MLHDIRGYFLNFGVAGRRKKEVGEVAPTSHSGAIFLLEVTLQQALQALAVARIVIKHSRVRFQLKGELRLHPPVPI